MSNSFSTGGDRIHPGLDEGNESASARYEIRVLLTQPNNPTGDKVFFSPWFDRRLTYVLANIESALLAEGTKGVANEDRVQFRSFWRGYEFGKALLPPGGARLASSQLPTLRLPVLNLLVCFFRWFETCRFDTRGSEVVSISRSDLRNCCTAKYP